MNSITSRHHHVHHFVKPSCTHYCRVRMVVRQIEFKIKHFHSSYIVSDEYFSQVMWSFLLVEWLTAETPTLYWKAPLCFRDGYKTQATTASLFPKTKMIKLINSTGCLICMRKSQGKPRVCQGRGVSEWAGALKWNIWIAKMIPLQLCHTWWKTAVDIPKRSSPPTAALKQFATICCCWKKYDRLS